MNVDDKKCSMLSLNSTLPNIIIALADLRISPILPENFRGSTRRLDGYLNGTLCFGTYNK